MEPFRLKMKIGLHEFEAEGAEEAVKAQFEIWRQLIASPSASVQPPASAPPQIAPQETAPKPLSPLAWQEDLSRADFDRLFRHEGRVVTLTALPIGERREADAALLMLLGQRIYNGEELLTGSPVLEGLQRSGMSVQRADRVFDADMDTNVIRVGTHRAVRYRLTNLGLARAREVAKDLLTRVT